MKNSQWTRKDLFAGLRRRLRRGKSSLRKIQRQLKLESLETRKLLTVTVSAQPLIMLAGDVRSVQVTLDGQLTAPATVDYVVSDGSAAEGADFFVPPATTLSFQPGQTIADIIPVFTNADPAAVANKWFTITLGNPTGELSLGTSQTVCTLLESTAVIEPQFVGSGMDSFLSPQSLPAQATDLPTVSIRGPRTMSGSSNTDFLVTLSQPADSAVTVEYATKIGGTDSTSDGPAATGYTTIPAGGTYGWISPPTLDDLVNEASDEYLTVSVTGATGAAVPADTAARAVRPMSPSPPTVSINDAARVNESGTTSFGVTLSHSTTSPVTVYYYTNDGSAKQGVNYTAAGQGASITIPAGSVSGWIPVVTRDDHVYEQNDLDFTAGISSATGASVPTGTSAYGGIHNIDATSANHGGVCACQPVSNDDGGLLIDAPTIPGATSLSSPDANAKDYQIGPPAVLTTSSFGVVVTRQNGDLQVWQSSGGSYTKTNSVTQGTLTQPGGSGTDFIETDLDGTQWIFAGSTGNGYQLGQIKSMTPPGGGGAVTYTYPSGQWRSVTATSSSTSQSATYTLSSGKVTAVSVINDSGSTQTSVSSAALTYYSSGQNGGPTDDLELLLAYDGAGALTNATYYRYYQGNYRAGNESGYNSGDNPGMQDELKFVVSGTDLERLMKANNLSSYSQLDGLTDAQVDAYADDFYKYNTNNLIQEIDAAGGGCSNCGGVGASTFAYAYNSPSTDATVWFSEKVETRADGSTVTTFDNYLGETILQDTWNGLSGSGSQHAITYNYYDSTNGNILDAYQPSAMTGSTPYTFNGTTLSVSPNSSTGVVNVYQYYSSLSAPEYTSNGDPSSGGGVPGYLYLTGVQQGQDSSTLVWQTKTDYVQKTVVYDSTSYYYYYSYDSTQFADTSYDTGSGTGGSPRKAVTHYTFGTNGSVPYVTSTTTVLPAVGSNHHGSGTSGTSSEIYDSQGRVVWSMDANCAISYMQYDAQTGAVVKRIQDVNTNDTGDFTNLPSGWSNTTGKELITSYAVDALGRTTKEVDPDSNVTYTVYNDANQEVRVYPGWHQDGSGYWQPTGVVSVARTDLTGTYSESLTYSWVNPANLQGSNYLNGDGSPKGGELVTNSNVTIQSLSRSIFNNSGQVVQSLGYVNFTGTAYTTSTAAFGTSGANYLETDLTYDALGRAESSVDAAGTIHFTVYNPLGRETDDWSGTRGSSTASNTTIINDFRSWVHNSSNQNTLTYTGDSINLYKTTHNAYDIDGDLTQSDAYFDPAGASSPRSTYYQYDPRDREIGVRGPDTVATIETLDNLGEATQTQTYANTTYSSGVIGTSSTNLRGQSQSDYDSLGRVYESRTYNVNPSNGTVGDELPSDTWYDGGGNVLAARTGSGPIEKAVYDGAGELIKSYTCADASPGLDYNYVTAVQGSLSAYPDTVVQQNQTWCDADGNTIASATFEQLPGNSTTGALTAANSYVTASVSFYDLAGRNFETVTYGREDTGLASGLTHYFFNGTSGALIDANTDSIPDAAQSTPPSPNSSTNYIVNEMVYTSTSASGPIVDSINNAGIISETRSDLLVRTIRTIQNFDGLAYGATGSGFDSNGNVLATSTAKDVTTDYQYDTGGRLVTQTAYDAKGSGTSVVSEATRYLYASSVDGGLQTAEVAPDSTDTVTQNGTTLDWSITSGSDHTSTTYDLTGATLTATDQRGVVHTYLYDSAGREYADTVTNLGSSGVVDNAVLAIVTGFDDIGRVSTVTSYSSASSFITANIVNQVKDAYDGWGNLTQEWQSHVAGQQVNTSTTPSVQYAYDDGQSGGVAQYLRLDHALYPNGRRVNYNYAAGVDSIMSRISNIKTNGEGTAHAAYTYLGAGTIVKEDYLVPQVKLDYTGTNNSLSGLDRFGRVVDQIWKNYSGTALDEYTYGYNAAGDRTSRGNAQHNVLNESYQYDGLDRLTSWSVNGTQQKAWSLDALGNNLTAGTYDSANQESPNGGIVTYDAAGNMTTLTNDYSATYDAWDRLVSVVGAETCKYDGLNRRIQVSQNSGPVIDDYLAGQQVVESDVTTSGTRNGGYQYVWSPRYIDAPIVRDTLNTAGTGIVSTSRVFYLGDANYNVTALVNTSGTVLERYSYTPYGVVTYRNADWSTASSSANGNTTLFAGRELDLVPDLYYNRARYYDPSLERFVGRDPLGFAAGDENVYRYCSDSPADEADPSGEKAAQSLWLKYIWDAKEKADIDYQGTKDVGYSQQFQFGYFVVAKMTNGHTGNLHILQSTTIIYTYSDKNDAKPLTPKDFEPKPNATGWKSTVAGDTVTTVIPNDYVANDTQVARGDAEIHDAPGFMYASAVDMKKRLSKYKFVATDVIAEHPDVKGTMTIEVVMTWGRTPQLTWSAKSSDGNIDEHGVTPQIFGGGNDPTTLPPPPPVPTN